MNERLFETYRAIHQQVFVPIFTEDGHNSRKLVEACVMAGCRVIEYTLRRHDVPEMIPWIHEHFPDLYLLSGSTIDDDFIVHQSIEKHPQLRTLDQLAEMGVDGFVTMIGFKTATIQRFSETHVVIPMVMTIGEAYQALCAGAHFIKIMGPSTDLVRLCRSDGFFGLCPIFVTGGMTLERIPDTLAAGAMVVGTGLELVLKDLPLDYTAEEAGAVIRRYIQLAQSCRSKVWPALNDVDSSDIRKWLQHLPHFHPFHNILEEVG